MTLGVHFRERLRGRWHKPETPGDEHAVSFALALHIPLTRALTRDVLATLSGEVRVEGVARAAAIEEGTLGVGAIARERRLPYRFSFRGDDGRRYRFDGAKEIVARDLMRSFLVLPGYLFDDAGEEVARAVLRSDPRADWWPFLRSLGLSFERGERR